MKLAINGLGRIGRLALRQLVRQKDVEIVAVNDIADIRTMAHLIKYDSVHGKAGFPVGCEGNTLVLDGRRIPAFQEREPGAAPFAELGAGIVLECTGRFGTRDELSGFLRGGVGHLVLSNPLDEADLTVVMGVNHERFDPVRHRIVSNASCTTNCLAPMAQVLDQAFGLDYGLVTAVHAYTNDQRILDLPHKDLRRARAASLSMIPTTTEALRSIEQVLPRLAGRLDGIAVRVPTPDVSIVDFSAMIARAATREAINEAFRSAAAAPPLNGYLEVVEDEIVSVDLTGSSASCLFDPFLTKVMTPRYIKIFGWYDNEFGYASRLKDLALFIHSRSQEVTR